MQVWASRSLRSLDLWLRQPPQPQALYGLNSRIKLAMVFAELQYDEHYSDFHAELIRFIEDNFENVESGLQGDSWVWITEGEQKVAIDTFTSMKHQIKCPKKNSTLVIKVIEALQSKFEVNVKAAPECEAHE